MSSPSLRATLCALISVSSVLVNGQTSPAYFPSPWISNGTDWDDAHAKAVAFVSQLTLLEKVNLTTGIGWEQDKCVGNSGSIPRLGFDAFCMQDSPLGVRDADLVSAFPAGINAAATWDRDLIYARGYAMGSEHRDKGVDVQLGPVAGPLGRSPEGGRNWEGLSPDPVLAGIAIAETIKGIQDAGVIACAKHYILNEQEHYRTELSSNAADKAIHELYLWPFADAVRAGVGSIMCSYNEINNTYACENSYTLNKLLKSELDFQGFVMSDWNAQMSGVDSALAGLDMSMPGDLGFGSGISYWGANLTQGVINGSIPEWRVDDMAVRIMSAYYKVGRDKTRVPTNFDSWTNNTTGPLHWIVQQDSEVINSHINVQGDHASNIREVGARSVVLLKNTGGALPLTNPESVAVIGEDAHLNPGGANACSDRGCDTGTLAMGWGSGTANFPYLVAPVDALRARAGNATFANISNNYNSAAVTSVATGKSVALVFVNSDAGEGYITVGGNAGDRNNLTLWGNGDNLVAEVSAVNPNTIVILHTVGPVLLDTIQNNPNVTAILWAGVPGQESGNSLTDVLYGDVNPSAKTPFTWGKARADWGTDILYSSSAAHPEINFSEGVFVDYRYFDKANITPTYEFGYGLSYTTFNYSDIIVTEKSASNYVPANGTTGAAPTYGTIDTNPSDNTFPADITRVPQYIYPYLSSASISTNDTGSWPSGSHDSSPQPLLPAGGAPGGNAGLYDILYEVNATVTNTGSADGIEVAQLYISIGGPDDPVVQLRNFDTLSIPAGGSTTFSSQVTRRDISSWDSDLQDWTVTSYPKTVFVGASSRKLYLQSTLSSYSY